MNQEYLEAMIGSIKHMSATAEKRLQSIQARITENFKDGYLIDNAQLNDLLERQHRVQALGVPLSIVEAQSSPEQVVSRLRDWVERTTMILIEQAPSANGNLVRLVEEIIEREALSSVLKQVRIILNYRDNQN